MSWISKLCVAALITGACNISYAEQAAETSLNELEKQFVEPPAKTKILKIIHNWPDAFEQQDSIREDLLRHKGFGGIVSNVHFDQYMESDVHWNAFYRAVTEAKKEGANLWLYDEKGYPSGNAGGLVLRKNPKWEAEGLLTYNRYYDKDQVVEFDVPPGKVLCALAIPMKGDIPDMENTINLTAGITDGKLKAFIHAGYTVTVITHDSLYEGTHAQANLYQHTPYINLLSKDATYEFARVTYENYAQRFGDDLGKYFESTFTDEPSLMSVFLHTMPYACLPWSDDFVKEFKTRCGYDITPLVPLLTLDSNGQGKIAKVKYDFWKTVGDLVAEYYFGQIQDFCAKYHIPSGGHLISEESMATHIPFYGNFFACIRRLDSPSMDCLTSIPPEVPWYVARLLSSAAELNDKRLVMSETSDHGQVYRPAGDNRPRITVTEDEIRGTLGRQIVAGVNRITSYYSWNGLTDQQIQELNDWTGRSILMTEGGNQVVDTAVLYPVESCWPRYIPSRTWANDSADVLAISGCYATVSDSLWRSGRDFTIIDSRAITDAAVTDKGLEHPCGVSWRAVILPSVDTLPLETWKQLEKFVQKGGILIASGALPQNSETDFPSSEVKEISKRLFGAEPAPLKPIRNEAGGIALFLPMGMESMNAHILNNLLERDFTTDSKESPLRVTHRSFPDREVYYIFNDSKEPCQETVRFAASGHPRMWDPNTGKVTALEESESYQIKLAGWNAAVFTFDKQKERKQTGDIRAFPAYEATALKLNDPGKGAGEFVRTTVEKVENDSAWNAKATLTKGNTDTFLFLCFGQELDLSGMELITLDIKVPPSQRTSTQLLAILIDSDGGQYLAQSGFSLCARGQSDYRRVYIPRNQFGLAGWSSDPNGKLDLDKIKELRIGWGGYYGVEGENVEFTLKNISVLK
ncbi:MAG: hypothetical protein IK033_03910 [Verrucomicrobia bacterium]|nr:hypothetical protein [Verrucomicrobiota bacterium]